MYDFFLKSCGK